MKHHISTVHENKKPSKCDICGKGFTSNRSRNEHVTSVHEKKKPYTCQSCQKGFPSRKNLKRHMIKCKYSAEKIEVVSSRKKKQTTIKCTACDDKNVAEWFCKDCEENICEPCHKAHLRVKFTRNHSLDPLNK